MRRVRIVVRQLSNLVRLTVLVMPCLVAAAACDRPDWEVVDLGPGGTSFAGAAVVAGTGVIGFAGMAGQACAFDRVVGTKPILSAQTMNSNMPGRTELYALVSDAEAEALRAGGSLVPPADPMAVPDVVKLLDKLLAPATMARKSVIEALKPRFASVRRGWPNPWALRLVDHAASEHLNAVRLVLREDAWIAQLLDGSIRVVDLKNVEVTPDKAAASADRIAAVFYALNSRSFVTTGGDPCEDGRREYVIASDAMIQEWSLGTEEILARHDDDLTKLEEFFKVARNCGSTTLLGGGSFRVATACGVWPNPFNSYSEYTAYQWSLSTPNELFKPTSQNIASLIEALQGDRFEPTDPYVVLPEPPTAGGAGGEGNEGGASGAAIGGAGSK
ncbi:MAG TPA: hypothetical protein VJN18_13570 [Polyangiaceae bacterium]|nr:hypothetical protein [Polyangiaceae bacterium]